MDAEHPTSPRKLLLRVAATLLALLLLYVLSIGPAAYVVVKAHNYSKGALRFYAPLIWAIKGTPLEMPIVEYVGWWLRLAPEDPF